MSTILERLRQELIIGTDYFELKSFAIQAKYLYITYPRHVDDLPGLKDYLVQKIKDFDPFLSVSNYSLVKETSILLHRHTHVFLELKSPPSKKIRDSKIFDLKDGTHPNIIASVNHSGDIHKKIYIYHRKTGDFAKDSFSDEDKLKWEDTISLQATREKTSVRSTPASQIQDFSIDYRENSKKYKDRMSIPEIESCLSASSRMRHEITDPPPDYDMKPYESLVIDELHDPSNRSFILHVINRKDDSHFSDFRNYLYNHFSGVCPIQYKYFTKLDRFIHGYNTSTINLSVDTIVTQVFKESVFPIKDYLTTITEYFNNDLFIFTRAKAKKVKQSSHPNAIILSQQQIVSEVSKLSDHYKKKSLFLFVDEKYEYRVFPDFELTPIEKENDKQHPNRTREEKNDVLYKRMLIRRLKFENKVYEVPLKIYSYQEIFEMVQDSNNNSHLKSYFKTLFSS